MLLLTPFALLGIFQCAIPYLITKRYVEKTFKRKVFWGSVKFIMGQIVVALIAIPQIFMFYYFIYPSWWLAFLYFFSIGITGLSAYEWVRAYKNYSAKKIILRTDLSDILKRKADLENDLQSFLPDF